MNSHPRIVSVAASPVHGFSKAVQPAITLIAGEGVEGDAHRGRTVQHVYLKRIDATQQNLAQVHLFAAEMLTELAAAGHIVAPGELGENVLTHGIDLLTLPLGTRLHLGPEVVLELTGLRTPCRQIDKFQPGLQAKLWGPPGTTGEKRRRAGVMSIVLAGGVTRPGDAIRVELPTQPHKPLGPV